MSAEDAEPERLIFYTRQECHLCEVARAALAPLLEEHGLDLEVRDVDDRSEWADAYGDQVPVGILGGRKLFKYRVDPARIRRALGGRKQRPDRGRGGD